MPKVQITLEVADAGATRNIQQFGRSVQDAFSQVKAGDPALQSATVRVQQLTNAKVQATAAAGTFGQSLLRVAEIATGISLANIFASAASAMRDLVSEGVNYNRTLELQKLGIASIVAATNDITDAQGRQLTGSEKIGAAQRITADLYQQIQRDAIQTVATTEQLVQAFQQVIGPASAAGLTLQQTRDITKDIVLAWGALGRPMHMVAQEARAMLSGDIDRNAELAKALGITSDMVKTAREQGTLYQLLKDRLKDFSTAAELSGETFDGLLSTIRDIAALLLGQAFSGVFEVLRGHLKVIRESLLDASGTLRQEWVPWLQDVSALITQIAKGTLFIAEGWAKITAEIFRQQRMFEAIEFNNQVAEVERLTRALEEAGRNNAFPAQILVLRQHLDAANAKLQEMIRHRAKLEEPPRESAGAAAGLSIAPIVRESKNSTTAVSALDAALKPLQANFALLTAQFEAGDRDAESYIAQLDQLILVTHELKAVTVEEQTALLKFQVALGDAIGRTQDAREDTSKFGKSLQDLGDDLSNLDGLLQAGKVDKWTKAWANFKMPPVSDLNDDLSNLNNLLAAGKQEKFAKDMEATNAAMEDFKRKMMAGADSVRLWIPPLTEFQKAVNHLEHDVIRTFQGALGDLLLSATEGFKGLEDIGKRVLNSLLAAIADFVASEAVRLFIDFIKSFRGTGGTPSSGGGSSSGGGDSVIDDIVGGIVGGIVDILVGQGQRAGEAIGEATTKSIRNDLPDVGRDTGAQIGGTAGGGIKDAGTQAANDIKDAGREAGRDFGSGLMGAVGTGAARGAALGGLAGFGGGPMGAIGGAIMGGLVGAIGGAARHVGGLLFGAIKDAIFGTPLENSIKDIARQADDINAAYGKAIEGLKAASDAIAENAKAEQEAANAALNAAEAARGFAMGIGEAGEALGDAARAAMDAADVAREGSMGDSGSGADAGDPGGSGHGAGGDAGDAGGQGPGGLARGGITRRNVRTTVHANEAVIPLDQRGLRFLERALSGVGAGAQTVIINVDGRKFAEFIVGRKGRPAGALVG